jgi:serine/threonine protein kinase
MNKDHVINYPDHIERFFEGRLSSAEQSKFEKHLDSCPTCRELLDTSAADKQYWTDAAIYLRDDLLDTEFQRDSLHFLPDAEGLRPDERFDVLRFTDYFDPTDDPRMLGRFGGYEIVGIIGCGGMGVVLKGFESALNRYVAIKVLAPHLATSGAARTRFAREACAAAAVLHENVVAIHRVAEDKGLPYLVMPYMPGDSLQKRLDERGPLDLGEILRIGMQIASGLAAAHAQGLIHRDIKPANILLDKGVERVTLTDFGLARATDDASLTRSGTIAGTPQYMSPEQARGEMLDARSDLFSLGSVLYAICAGRAPFRAQTLFGVLQRIMGASPTPIREIVPEVPDWLCEIIEKLHAKSPDERFQTAGEVADLLGRWLMHVRQPTVVPAPRRVGRPKRRMKKLRQTAAVASIIAALGVGSIVALPFLRTEDGDTKAHSDVASSAPNAEVAEKQTNNAVLPSFLSEQAINNESREIQERASRLEREWISTLPRENDDAWNRSIAELHRQIDALSKRIENNLP